MSERLEDVAPINRIENSAQAQNARSRYITANEQVHRLHNRGADLLTLAKAEAARDRAGDAWEKACNPGVVSRVEDTPGAYDPGFNQANARRGGESFSRPSPDPAEDSDDQSENGRVTERPANTRMGLCRSCKAPIIWATSREGKTAILDAKPTPEGNVYFLDDGTVAYTKKTLPAPADAILYTSHFANCPDRDRWRSPS